MAFSAPLPALFLCLLIESKKKNLIREVYFRPLSFTQTALLECHQSCSIHETRQSIFYQVGIQRLWSNFTTVSSCMSHGKSLPIQMSCQRINIDCGENGETRTIYLAFIASQSLSIVRSFVQRVLWTELVRLFWEPRQILVWCENWIPHHRTRIATFIK